MNILLIEDNIAIIKGLNYSLKINNYNLIAKTTIREAKTYLENNLDIALIILDITLPDGNGFSFFDNYLKLLNIPVIFLTAQDEEEMIVTSLNKGAEDYLIKPFSTKELLARINKTLRHYQKQNIIKIQDLTYDFDKMVLKYQNNIIELTPLELKLINLLFLNMNKVVSRTMILDKIWEWTGNDVDDHTITVYFNRLREKIKVDIIKTIKGVGYRIDEK